MNTVPQSLRLNIGVFGRTNAGKSTLVNMLAGHKISIESDVKGTTTDPVSKSIEINGLGAVVIIDTAGYDDRSVLGKERILATNKIIDKTNVAIIVFSDILNAEDTEFIFKLKKKNIPFVLVKNVFDKLSIDVNNNQYNSNDIRLQKITEKTNENEKFGEIKVEKTLYKFININAKCEKDKLSLVEELARLVPEDFGVETPVVGMVKKYDTVMLVMPQDLQAPKGRLILPQVSVIRALLDEKCLVICATLDTFDLALSALKNPPKLIITDSQIFKEVNAIRPKESKMTSFSVLFANYKGDMNLFLEGAKKLAELKDFDKVLIAEACTHIPLNEDIGRVKIPKLLKKFAGENLQIEVVSGNDFPEDLTPYSLVIHCGACMFNKKLVMTRIEKAKEFNVPITNYGVAIAFMTDVLKDVYLGEFQTKHLVI